MTRLAAGVFVTLLIALGAGDSAWGIHAFGRAGTADHAPEVRIISPDDETVDLRGGQPLTLYWSRFEGDRIQRRYYDIRIYRGYEMLERTLIFKTRAEPDTDRVTVDNTLFEDGTVYTWSIRQRYYGMAQSRRSYASFRVIKR